MAEQDETGLGLSIFLEGEQPSPEPEKTDVAEGTEEVTEEKTEGTVEEPPKEAESPAEEKVEEKEEPPSSDWESDDNPFRKRYKDTADWANKTNQENLELKRQLNDTQIEIERVKKMQEGTWTEGDEQQYTQGQQIDPQAISQMSETAGRIVSSREAAFDKYGEDKVQKTLFDADAPFKLIENRPEVISRVMTSPSPVLEAMKVVREYSFKAKYGETPDDIIANIKKEHSKELEDQITKKVLDNIKKSEAQPKGISEARSQGPGGQPPGEQDFELKDLSPHLSQ